MSESQQFETTPQDDFSRATFLVMTQVNRILPGLFEYGDAAPDEIVRALRERVERLEASPLSESTGSQNLQTAIELCAYALIFAAPLADPMIAG